LGTVSAIFALGFTPVAQCSKIEKQAEAISLPHGGDFYSTAQSVDLNRGIAVSHLFFVRQPWLTHSGAFIKLIERLNDLPARTPPASNLANPFFLARISFWLQVAFFAALAAVA